VKKIILTSLALFLTGIVALYAESLRFEEKEEIRKTLKFQDPSQPKELMVDNIFGSIEVEGWSNQEVQLVARKTIKARSAEKIQKAKEEVRLDISEEKNTVDLYVDGPFRPNDSRRRWRSWRDPGYEVQFDFELKVPHKTNLYLRTVNNGNIRIKNVEGEFEVKNVNGRIEMTEIAGAGCAHAVNGEVKVLFSRNPESDCSFRTINGNLEIFFCPDLSANLRLKTFNGKAYTDFPVTFLRAEQPVGERHNGKYVYKSNRFFGVQAGKGGPEIEFDTLNGDILIGKRNK
jgi:hypothetical protein